MIKFEKISTVQRWALQDDQIWEDQSSAEVGIARRSNLRRSVQCRGVHCKTIKFEKISPLQRWALQDDQIAAYYYHTS